MIAPPIVGNMRAIRAVFDVHGAHLQHCHLLTHHTYNTSSIGHCIIELLHY